MKRASFKPSESVYVLPFVERFKLSCNGNKIHKEAAILFLLYYIIKPAKSAFSHQVTAINKKNIQ